MVEPNYNGPSNGGAAPILDEEFNSTLDDLYDDRPTLDGEDSFSENRDLEKNVLGEGPLDYERRGEGREEETDALYMDARDQEISPVKELDDVASEVYRPDNLLGEDTRKVVDKKGYNNQVYDAINPRTESEHEQINEVKSAYDTVVKVMFDILSKFGYDRFKKIDQNLLKQLDTEIDNEEEKVEALYNYLYGTNTEGKVIQGKNLPDFVMTDDRYKSYRKKAGVNVPSGGLIREKGELENEVDTLDTELEDLEKLLLDNRETISKTQEEINEINDKIDLGDSDARILRRQAHEVGRFIDEYISKDMKLNAEFDQKSLNYDSIDNALSDIDNKIINVKKEYKTAAENLYNLKDARWKFKRIIESNDRDSFYKELGVKPSSNLEGVYKDVYMRLNVEERFKKENGEGPKLLPKLELSDRRLKETEQALSNIDAISEARRRDSRERRRKRRRSRVL